MNYEIISAGPGVDVLCDAMAAGMEKLTNKEFVVVCGMFCLAVCVYHVATCINRVDKSYNFGPT